MQTEGLESSSPGSLLAAAVDEASTLARNGHEPEATRGLAIAALLDEIRAEPDIRAAAVLYPLAAAGAITGEAVAKRHGPEMRRRIEELQRLGSFGLPENWTSGTPLPGPQAETLRKMLLAIVADVRLVLVRLADQLDRLQRARTAAAELRERIATETREIFAPLANRLGIWHFKWQMEDLAFRYLEPETYRGIAQYLKQTREGREGRIEEVIAHPARRAAEGRHPRRGRGPAEAHLQHLAEDAAQACRHRAGLRHQRRARPRRHHSRVLRGARPGAQPVALYRRRVRRLHREPKGNFYRSLHTAVLGPGQEPLEVQIRTREMHEHAELGVAAHWRYKEGGRGDPAFEQKISWLRQLLAPGDDGEADRDLLEQLRTEIFEDRVYAFTPAGDVVDMPAGATPLDFAYQVHTNVGHHCRGARVNGRMVQLTHQLKNGDKVEILTAKNARPSRDWLLPQAGYLASPRSRSKVRAWFRLQDQDQNRRSGKHTLEKELARLGLDVKLDAVAARFGLQGEEQLWLAVGAGDLTMPAVIAACERESPAPEPAVSEEVQVKARRPTYTEAAVSISGVGDLMTNFARCCRPLPPEPIAGYITQGRGVSIHRANCKNLLRLQAEHPQRLMSVDWGGREHASYPVEIEVQAWDRTGLIRDISALLADEKIDINAMTTRTERSSHQATIDITAGIGSLEHLSRLLHRIGRLPNVTSVRRKA